jgi:DNA helicase INO80
MKVSLDLSLLQISRREKFEHVLTHNTGEGQFDDASADPSGAATPMSTTDGAPATKKQRKNAAGISKKVKLAKARLAVVDGDV